MLRFNVEWQEASGVRELLARGTWGRLEIHASGGGAETCLTQCVSRKTNGLRDGVYGTVFPLARWVVENWWSILFEGLRAEGFRGGRELGGLEEARPWVQRHNLLVGRGGSALPDLSLFRDGDFVILGASPDPDDSASPDPVRFLSDRILRLPPQEVEQGLRRFVTTVLERINESKEGLREEPEAAEFQENWNAILAARGPERRLCETAAAMGLDPYDPRELTDELAVVIEEDVSRLEDELRGEFVAATRAEKLVGDLDWLRAARGRIGAIIGAGEPPAARRELGQRPAHEAGYEAAARLRVRIGLAPAVVKDLGALMAEADSWDPCPDVLPSSDTVAHRLSGLVGRGDRGRLRVVAPGLPPLDEDVRFLLARSWSLTAEPIASAASLLARSSSWVQRASRAFAAELLAPAAALSSRVSGRMVYEQVEDLAREFKVRPDVIRRQIQNHRLAVLVDA